MFVKKYDIIIVGAGATGLTAALYASRHTLKTLVVSKNLGGQAALTDQIENYPGFDFITGVELINKFKAQTDKFGTEFLYDEVNKIKKEKGDFSVKIGNQYFQTKTVVLAFGLTPRDLAVPGEKKLTGKGVSYCAICDAAFFRDKVVAVVGGGNSALEAAETLSRLARKVYLIHRREEFRGDEILIQTVKKLKNIELVLNSEVQEIHGQARVEKITVRNNQEKSSHEIEVAGVFIEVGYKASTDWLKGVVELNERGEVVVDKNCNTSVSGIYAAGDVTDLVYKQIVTSAGEGCKAALQAYKYIQKQRGSTVLADWGIKKK